MVDMVLEGIAYYAFTNKTNKDGRYTITIANLNDKARKQLKAAGVKPKFEADDEHPKHEWGWFVYANNNIKPKAVDAKKNPLPENVIIGNGSKVRVAVSTYEGKGAHATVYLNLNAVQVLELVPYESKGFSGEISDHVLNAFDEEDGFDVSTLDEEEEEDEPTEKVVKKTKKVADKSKRKRVEEEEDFEEEFDLDDEIPF